MKPTYYDGYDLDIDRLENIIIHLENDEICDFMIGTEPIYNQLEELLVEITSKLKEKGFKEKSDLPIKFKDFQKRAFIIFFKEN